MVIKNYKKILDKGDIMMNTKKKDCIPIEERKQNEVDELKARIKKIQEDCQHDWRFTKKPELRKSFVPGVFIGNMTTPSGMSYPTEISLACMKCSKKLVASITAICPLCLGSMDKGGLYTVENDGKSSREKYFGEYLAYYAIRIYHCNNCGCAVASDEWNQ